MYFKRISFYFSFMWQICGSIPQSLLHKTDVTCIAAQLSVSFFIETFIHAKEKVCKSKFTSQNNLQDINFNILFIANNGVMG